MQIFELATVNLHIYKKVAFFKFLWIAVKKTVW